MVIFDFATKKRKLLRRHCTSPFFLLINLIFGLSSVLPQTETSPSTYTFFSLNFGLAVSFLGSRRSWEHQGIATEKWIDNVED
jgi:hypothetical protein